MEKLRYFSRIGQQTQSKNKLQAALHKFAKDHERLVFKTDSAEQFLKLCDNIVKQLNAEYSRCPAEVHEVTVRKDTGDITLKFGGTVSLQLITCREKEVGDEK